MNIPIVTDCNLTTLKALQAAPPSNKSNDTGLTSSGLPEVQTPQSKMPWVTTQQAVFSSSELLLPLDSRSASGSKRVSSTLSRAGRDGFEHESGGGLSSRRTRAFPMVGSIHSDLAEQSALASLKGGAAETFSFDNQSSLSLSYGS